MYVCTFRVYMYDLLVTCGQKISPIGGNCLNFMKNDYY